MLGWGCPSVPPSQDPLGVLEHLPAFPRARIPAELGHPSWHWEHSGGASPIKNGWGGSQAEPLQGPDLQGEPLHPSLLLLSLFSAAASARKGHFSLVKKGRI